MALIQRGPSRKKQIQLAIALGGIILITGLVAYFGIFANSGTEAPQKPVSLISVPTNVKKVPTESGLDTMKSLFELPLFRKLKQFGTWPLSSEPKGRSEPFVIPQ